MLAALGHLLDLLDVRACLLLLTLLLLAYFYFRRPKNLPPGPRCWPVVGSLPSLANTDDVHLKFLEWQKEYGPVVYFRMGMLDAVMLGGYDVIYQALVKQAEVFSSRPAHLAVVNKITKRKGIVLVPSGPYWKEQRKFALVTLRSFGFGKRSLEARISREFAELRERIHSMDEEPFDINRLVQKAATNIICYLVFAHRFEYEDPTFLRIMKDFDEIAATNFINLPENVFPFLRHVLNSGDKLIKTAERPHDYIRAEVQQHRETFDQNDIRDYIDSFLLEMMGTQNQNNSSFTEEQLVQTVFDLFIGGTESTATGMRWAILLMAENPDIQRKVQEEIDSVLGKGQPPSMSHRAQLPYTQAVLTEVLRYACIVTLIVPHTTTEDTVLYGYHIPKQSLIIPSLWSVHYDEKLFPQPNKFDPIRFLDEKGQYKKDEHVIPFSAGPRTCLGEQLARMELFLFFTSLMQHFTFNLPEGASVSSQEATSAGVRAPKPYEVVALARN